ncbi:MAG: 4-hydroxythreonine-4-phosphate dehydrogenase PdxA [Fervidicoccaceae archaeon]
MGIILITIGDPAGSGPEIVLKALSHKKIYERSKIAVIGSLKVLEKAREIVKANSLKLTKIEDPGEVEQFEPMNIGVVDLDNVDPRKIVYGSPSELGGRTSFEYISKAVELILKRKGTALVTAPISKESLHMAGINYPGHTELLADLAGVKEVRMMLVAGNFRVSHVTTHVSLRKAIEELIKKERILKTIEMTYEALVKFFCISEPKIAVSGLNPHASENGLFGDEELREISPAIEAARERRINALGPFPPDTIFYRAYREKEFDAVIAMYHDQGHIPVKMVGFLEGVNLTLGLPFVRTSPDHGTAWGKAGTGLADEKATLEAIKLAIQISENLENNC